MNFLIICLTSQRNCTGDSSWYTVGGSGNARSANRCGYEPYSLVSCWVRAKNSAGWSDEATHGSIRTLCDSKLVNVSDCQVEISDQLEPMSRYSCRYKQVRCIDAALRLLW